MSESKSTKPGTSRVRISPSATKYDDEREKLRKKSLSLIEETNRTFKELTSTLKREHNKISEIEIKRNKLLNEMMELKKDIEKEKEACRIDLAAFGIDETDEDAWYVLSEEEMGKQQRISGGAALKTVSSKSSNISIHKKRRNSREISNDILTELDRIAKRGRNPHVP